MPEIGRARGVRLPLETVTTDRRRFTQRTVQVGEPLDGQYPVLAGLRRGELAVTDGAVFVSNILYAPPSD